MKEATHGWQIVRSILSRLPFFQREFADGCVYFQPYDRLIELFADPEASTERRAELSGNILSYAQQIVPDCDIGTGVKANGEADQQLVKAVGYYRPMAEKNGDL